MRIKRLPAGFVIPAQPILSLKPPSKCLPLDGFVRSRWVRVAPEFHVNAIDSHPSLFQLSR
jgi:hypothetical protein